MYFQWAYYSLWYSIAFGIVSGIEYLYTIMLLWVLPLNRSRIILNCPWIVTFVTLHGSLQPCSLVIILKTCIRWITTQSRVYWLIQKYFHQYGHYMTMVLCHTPPISLIEPKKFWGVIYFEDHLFHDKMLIYHPVVYLLSSVSTLKNSSKLDLIRHIITKFIGTQFYCGTNFLISINSATAYFLVRPFSCFHSTSKRSCICLLMQVRT